jgi:hypothetical protein
MSQNAADHLIPLFTRPMLTSNKRQFERRFSLLLVLLFITLAPYPTSAQTKRSESIQPKNIVDFYLLLPDKYFEADRDQRLHWMLDPARGAIVDIGNGYIFAAGDGAQTDLYVCLFKRSNGKNLIAVNYNDKHDVFESFLDFYIYKRGKLLNVSKSVMPMAFNKDFYYALPRYGNTIVVTNKSGKKLYDLVWTKRVFRRKRA